MFPAVRACNSDQTCARWSKTRATPAAYWDQRIYWLHGPFRSQKFMEQKVTFTLCVSTGKIYRVSCTDFENQNEERKFIVVVFQVKSSSSKRNEITASNSNSLTNSIYTDSWMEIQKATNHKYTRISVTAMGIPLVTGDVVSVWELNQVWNFCMPQNANLYW